ncbi:YceI family protein [Flavobacterium sp. CYK-55]|uniref:YceI family protein n=1 Tax=Flavobacterium sp. CYK-55 TaxID=2835529 RepID=UPI001BCD1ABA|nr:YceI family protein [Flavobacterium sp. CYK-55]MBS7786345.1 YceI family protein [Flavobacterium sp. CYK-55]
MKKLVIIALSLLLGEALIAQKMMTRDGEIKFDASMPNLVEIAATNKTASCILDASTGDLAALALVKSFKFKSPLMEEHFNENYMESSKFPKATFKGKILNIGKIDKTKNTYDAEGDLTMHGVTKKVKIKVNLVQNASGKVNMTSNFTVKAKDYNIDIPNLVKENFAENIKVSLNFELEGK